MDQNQLTKITILPLSLLMGVAINRSKHNQTTFNLSESLISFLTYTVSYINYNGMHNLSIIQSNK